MVATRKNNWLGHWAVTMLRDANAADILWLAQFDKLREKVLFYDHQCHTCFSAGPEIPWPIIWLLGRFHKKHVFFSKRNLVIQRLNLMTSMLSSIKSNGLGSTEIHHPVSSVFCPIPGGLLNVLILPMLHWMLGALILRKGFVEVSERIDRMIELPAPSGTI